MEAVNVPTAIVDIVKVAEEAPAGTVNVLGTVTLELLEASAITAPPVGAGNARETVPVDCEPPIT